MDRLRKLIHEIHRRSLWQVLSIYVVGSWGVLSVVDTLGGALGLPDWFPPFALALLLLGLPVVLATAFVQEGADSRAATEAQVTAAPTPTPPAAGATRLFTWPRVFAGGVLAFALWGVVAAAWLVFTGGSSRDAASTASTARTAASTALTAVAAIEEAMNRQDWVRAYRLAMTLPPEVPDSARDAIVNSVSLPVRLMSDPPGAFVSWRPYGRTEEEFVPIGETPAPWRAPPAPVQLRFELDGYITLTLASAAFRLGFTPTLRRTDAVQPEAVFVPGVQDMPTIAVEARIAHAIPPVIGDFLIDRYEVTNREFMEFVDAGGYERREYWQHPFERDGAVLTWEEAMAAFVDQTGRPAPSTWSGGRFPEGEENYPVTGVSWYEAAAYAHFAGRTLPTVFHWSLAARPIAAEWIIPSSNFEGDGPAPVGTFEGISPFGVYDMAGNAREWVVNAAGDQRYTAGGGWNDPSYLFALTQPQPPFDRSETNGFRLMTDLGDPDDFAVASRPAEPIVRDFYAERPASDELYAELARLYEYGDTPLNAVVEQVDTLDVGIHERVTFDAGYGGDRMILHLFRPANPTGPLQTVVHFPGSTVLGRQPFGVFGRSQQVVSMIVRSGRAFAFPIYLGMFERADDWGYRMQDESNEYREHVMRWRQDLGRSIDYLATRPDVDDERLAYYGNSLGGRMGAIMLAVEPRFRAAVLTVPGLSALPTQPVVDPFNFLPRVRLPLLMISGEYDQTYPLETSARPFYEFLGTPDADKRHFIAQGGHGISAIDHTRETLDWLDRYLGEVR